MLQICSNIFGTGIRVFCVLTVYLWLCANGLFVYCCGNLFFVYSCSNCASMFSLLNVCMYVYCTQYCCAVIYLSSIYLYIYSMYCIYSTVQYNAVLTVYVFTVLQGLPFGFLFLCLLFTCILYSLQYSIAVLFI